MSQKDYKQGAADAMNAYEAFARKQEDAIHHVGNQIGHLAGDVEQLGKSVEFISDYITDKEKQALYQANMPVDIAELDGTDQYLLVAVLYELAQRELPTEEQQNYIRAVQKYLKVRDVQRNIDLAVVENIPDTVAIIAIMQVVMEYFYLGTHPGTYTDDEMDFLESFMANRKTRKEIMARIRAIVNAVGREGLAEKYGFVAGGSSAVNVSDDVGAIVDCLEKLKNIGCCGTIVKVALCASSNYPGYIDANSRHACKSQGEGALKIYYDGFVDALSHGMVLREERESFSNRSQPIINEVEHYLRLIERIDITGIIQKAKGILDSLPIVVSEAIEKVLGQGESTHSIRSFSYYSELVNIEEHKYGSGFFAERNYVYDTGNAVLRISEDSGRAAEYICNDINRKITLEIEKKIVEPITYLLQELV